jgi:hypothetical protein
MTSLLSTAADSVINAGSAAVGAGMQVNRAAVWLTETSLRQDGAVVGDDLPLQRARDGDGFELDEVTHLGQRDDRVGRLVDAARGGDDASTRGVGVDEDGEPLADEGPGRMMMTFSPGPLISYSATALPP